MHSGGRSTLALEIDARPYLIGHPEEGDTPVHPIILAIEVQAEAFNLGAYIGPRANMTIPNNTPMSNQARKTDHRRP